MSAARGFAARHGYAIDPRQEFLGIAAANLLAGLAQGYPVAGGLSQSAVSEKAGARSPLALVFASAARALALLYLTGLLADLPKAVLAASRPHVAFLGRVPGSRLYTDLARHPENRPVPGALLFRPEGSVLYVNAEAILAEVTARLDAMPKGGVRRVVCDLSASPVMDLAGVAMLRALHEALVERGAHLAVAGALGRVRDLMRREGFAALIGGVERDQTVESLLEREGLA